MLLRKLRETDLPDLMALKAAAGWNQTEDDWRLFLRYDSDGCFGIETDGHIVACSTSMCFGDQLAWIGMVLTIPEYRGRGYARQLTEVAVAYAGSRVIKLDASDMGRPLYESLGFVAECPVERWVRAPQPGVTTPEVEPVSWDPEVDTEAFGADRTVLLEEFAMDDAASVGDAYAFGREGSNGPYFGPCVSPSQEDARTLLQWFVSLHAHEPIYTDLFPQNAAAVANAQELGFVPVRHLTRMVLRPAEPVPPDPRIYATASFSWG